MFYNGIPKLKFFDESDLLEIEELAHGLSEQEVLDYYALDYSELQDNDLKYFNISFRRGRTRAKNRCILHLFDAMSDRNGAQACLSYLRQFADQFPAADSNSSSTSGKFSFNVSMNDPELQEADRVKE